MHAAQDSPPFHLSPASPSAHAKPWHDLLGTSALSSSLVARQYNDEDDDFYKKRLGRAVFLLREHGKAPEEAEKEKKNRKAERKRERAEMDDIEVCPTLHPNALSSVHSFNQ